MELLTFRIMVALRIYYQFRDSASDMIDMPVIEMNS